MRRKAASALLERIRREGERLKRELKAGHRQNYWICRVHHLSELHRELTAMCLVSWSAGCCRCSESTYSIWCEHCGDLV